MDEAEVEAHGMDDEAMLDVLANHFDVTGIQVFKELMISIKGNDERIRVRTHDTFHGRQPARAVMVASPYGESCL